MHLIATHLAALGLIVLLQKAMLTQIDSTLLQLHQIHLYELIQILLRRNLRFVTDATLLALLEVNAHDHVLTLRSRSVALVASSLMNTVVATEQLLLLK